MEKLKIKALALSINKTKKTHKARTNYKCENAPCDRNRKEDHRDEPK